MYKTRRIHKTQLFCMYTKIKLIISNNNELKHALYVQVDLL